MPRPKSTRTLVEDLNRDMDAAAYDNDPIARRQRPPKNKAFSQRIKNDPRWMDRLVNARVGTQFGGPNCRYCKATTRSGDPCRKLAIKGWDHCEHHITAQQKIQLKERRRAEGRPVDRAHRLARRNLKTVLRANKVPYDLLRAEIFQSVMKLVTPRWFGADSPKDATPFDRRRMKEAALLGREMVLAWNTGVETGDWLPWGTVTGKVIAAGFFRP